MSFLKPKTFKDEYEEKENELNKLREDRRNKYLKVGHVVKKGENDYEEKLLFSEDVHPIPYYRDDEYEYLITGEKCYEYVFDKNEKNIKLEYNEYIINYDVPDSHYYDHIKFIRELTHEEFIFMQDYNQLVKYKQIKKITEFQPNTTNQFTLGIFNKLKEKLKNDILKLKELEAKERINNYTPEESQQRLNNLIENFDYNKELNKINQETQKQLKIKDEEYNNELFKKTSTTT